MSLCFVRKTEMFQQQQQHQSVRDLWGLYCRNLISA